ncbi:major facilitator superfamily domain-containing protein [Terfezia claveryi]|nr:major facilitator superfamily domain-containing protein [Terfezia claveryi]
MFKVTTNEYTSNLPSNQVGLHKDGFELGNDETAITIAHHSLYGRHPVLVPTEDSASTLHGAQREEKWGGKGCVEGREEEPEAGRESLQTGSKAEVKPEGSLKEGLVDDNENFPEGGQKAWSVVLGSFCLLFAGLGIMNTIGTFQAYLSQNDLKDYPESTTGWIFGTHAFLTFLCGVQIGPIFDKRGPRLLVLGGSVGLLLTLFLMSVCKAFWHYFLVFGVLGGISVSLLLTPAVASVGHWFKAKRATATGLAITGGSIGGIVFPLVFQKLIPIIGFPWACRIVGFIQLALLIPANILVRSRLKPLPDAKASIDLAALLEPTFALTTFGVFLIEWGIFVSLTYLTSYAINAGMEESFAYQLLSIFNAGSALGRWLPNYAADIFGRFNVLVLTTLSCFITILGLWLPSGDGGEKTKNMLIAFAILHGFGSGSGIGLTPVCVGQICRTEDYGKRYGTCYSLASFASFTGIPLAGSIISNYHSYTGLIWFDAASYMGAVLLFSAARVVGAGWSPKAIF